MRTTGVWKDGKGDRTTEAKETDRHEKELKEMDSQTFVSLDRLRSNVCAFFYIHMVMNVMYLLVIRVKWGLKK